MMLVVLSLYNDFWNILTWFKATDNHEASSNSINCNSPKKASVDNQQPTQEQHIELIDSGGVHQGESESWAGVVHQERQASKSCLEW
jgi:hypothetical protein